MPHKNVAAIREVLKKGWFVRQNIETKLKKLKSLNSKDQIQKGK